MDPTREELMQLCLDGIVAQQYWGNRDSAKSMMQLGRAYALLKAGCNYTVLRRDPTDKTTSRGCFTDNDTIWIAVSYKGFDWFEESVMSTDTFYIPTRKRLESSMVQQDWY